MHGSILSYPAISCHCFGRKSFVKSLINILVKRLAPSLERWELVLPQPPLIKRLTFLRGNFLGRL